MKKYFSVILLLFYLLPGYSVSIVYGETNWDRNLRFSASLTSISSAHTEYYPEVSGIAGVDSQTSWQLGTSGRFERKTDDWSQEHRITLRFGKADGDVEEDEIDLNNILRRRFTPELFGYASARLRSEFDTFAHPSRFDGAGGVGYFLLDSDRWGELEFRLGARWSRSWNPSNEFDGHYEFIAEYLKTFENGSQFSSSLETYAPFYENDYTVRWDNTLLASVNSWLDIEYRFTLYYQDKVGETATRNISRVNFVYHLWPN